MNNETERCPVCQGRGYIHCECWPADCICGWGNEDCEYCHGHGEVETCSHDEWFEVDESLKGQQHDK